MRRARVALARGCAAASTDAGITPGAAFAMNHPKMVDYAHRAVQMTVQAKVLVSTFYGSAPRLSMWNGCSTGGRQGVIEASTYPADYDAIIAGATPVTTPRLHGVRLQFNRMVHRTGDSYIPPDKYPAIHQAALQACDGLDGVKDGVIDSPNQCTFDPKVLACSGADQPTCLTPAQVERLGPCRTCEGSEDGRNDFISDVSPWIGARLGDARGSAALRHCTRSVPRRRVQRSCVGRGLDEHDGYSSVSNTRQAALSRRPPTEAVLFAWRKAAHVSRVGRSTGRAAEQHHLLRRRAEDVGKGPAGKSIALYLVPGMGHCQGGAGTDSFDKVAAIEEWIRTGTAPAQIVAAHRTGGTADRTRPLCQYPMVAKYQGSGSTDDAANFVCAAR